MKTRAGVVRAKSGAKPKKAAPRASDSPRPIAGRKAKASASVAAARARPSKSSSGATASESRLVDQRIRDIGGWRGATLQRMRGLILEADPEMIEEVKWRKPSNSMAGVPVWSHDGMVCTGETYAKVVKLTFANGAKLADPSRLFNASLEGGTRRAIDIHEGETIDSRAFKALVKAAVAVNGTPKAKSAAGTKAAKSVRLLSGGNPQIAKGEGNAPVQAYIAAMPGWKRDIGRRLDALIERTVPNVHKAVKWNSPFYGVEGQGWFLGVHVFTRYVKVSFFKGESLRPVPPGGTPRSKESRWIDIHEGDGIDEKQMTKWVAQAAALPGWLS